MLPHKVFVTPGSIKMEDEKIPIFISFNHHVPPIGWATDLQVNDAGEISVAIEITDESAVHLAETDDLFKLYTVSMYLTNMVMQGKQFSEEGSTLLYGRLRSVSIVPLDNAGSWA